MNTTLVTLDSKTAVALSAANRSSNFVTPFYRGLFLPRERDTYWAVALQRANIWNSNPNVSATTWGNATWDYSHDNGVTWNGPYIIPEGTYSVDDINEYVHSIMFANGHYGGSVTVPLYGIEIIPNFNTLRTEIRINPPSPPDPGTGYQFQLFDFMTTLLGFSAPQIVVATVNGDQKVDITMGVDQISIRVDLVDSGASFGGDGNHSDSVYVFQFDVRPGALQDINPNNLTFLRVRSEEIKNVRCYLTDSRGRELNLRGEDIVITLLFKKFKLI